MLGTVVETIASPRPWLLTGDARERLVDEIAHLRRRLDWRDGRTDEDLDRKSPAAITRRIDQLTEVLERAALVDDPEVVAIGRRVSLRDAEGEPMSFTVALPGEGSPSKGLISADSPLGAAILGARVGDQVDVPAPAGSWTATVVEIG